MAIDSFAIDEEMPQFYGELRRIAHLLLRRGQAGETLNTTALVNEAWLKLAGADARFNDRQHFFAASARAMRHILVDAARRRGASKRGGLQVAATPADSELAIAAQAEQVLAIEEALASLADLDPRLTQVVECRVFAGYSEEETAEVLGLSLRTSQRLWTRARAWLAVAMS